MKKLPIILTIVATLASNGAFAQQTGRAASSAKSTATDDFAWGIGLVGLAVIGVVVGLTASAAAHDPSSFSH